MAEAGQDNTNDKNGLLGGASEHVKLEDIDESGTELSTMQLKERIRQLEIEINDLRQSSSKLNTDAEEKRPPVFQTLNRIVGLPEIFLGWPTLRAEGSRYRIRVNQTVEDMDIFLKGKENVAFLIERWFNVDSMPNIKEIEAANKAGISLPDPMFRSTRIQFNSDEMKDAFAAFLRAAEGHFGEFQNIDLDEILWSPYPFWFHCRKTGVVDGLTNREQELIKLLTDWIEENYGHEYSEADEMLERGFVKSSKMPYLIAPGERFSWKEHGQIRGYKANSWPRWSPRDKNDSIDSLDSLWEVSAWTYRYDGKFWQNHGQLNPYYDRVPEDDKELAISSLRAVPMRFETEENRLMLKKRGSTFWKCRSRRFVSYQNRETDDRLSKIDERYMIDFNVYRKLHSDTAGFKREYPKIDPGDYEEFDLMDDEGGPEGDDMMLFPPTIIGYDMRRKAWNDLNIDYVREIQWRKEAFNHLVVDEETKDLIHALITNKIAADKSTDWIITKGNGLIMLLHGGPGTGKTFTAESVAELAQKPLYSVTCGDIGTKPEDVEKYLESVLYLGKVWDCIILLDEADVFLEQRTLSDLKRNALVSVFLRVLEYYEGIMILTSNRVGIFDEAFKSRIQLALHYESLGRPERTKVWRNFFNRLKFVGEENIDYDTIDSYIEELSEYEVNGRQIRNAITTARQLAQFKKRPMTYGHLRHVIKVAGKFDNYLKGVHEDMSDEMIARGEGIR